MKVIIAGSRSIHEYEIVKQAVAESGFEITEVVSGRAAGVDRLGESWADEYNIPVKPFPADWSKWGKGAGHRRNTEMAEYADALVAVHNGSRGTLNMIKQMRMRKKLVFVKICRVSTED